LALPRLGYDDPRSDGERAHGLHERHTAHPHEEGEGVAAGVAAEAMKEAALGIDVKRRRLLGMERAEPDESSPALLERDVLGDHRGEIDPPLDLLEHCLRDRRHRLCAFPCLPPPASAERLTGEPAQWTGSPRRIGVSALATDRAAQGALARRQRFLLSLDARLLVVFALAQLGEDACLLPHLRA